MSLCDCSSSGRWTGGGYQRAWRALSTPYSPAADRGEKKEGRQEGGQSGGETKGIRSKKRKDLDVAERERNCKVLCPSWAELHLLAEFSTGGYVTS